MCGSPTSVARSTGSRRRSAPKVCDRRRRRRRSRGSGRATMGSGVQEVVTREAAALVAAALVAATQTEQEAQAKKRPCDEERGDVRCLGIGHGLLV